MLLRSCALLLAGVLTLGLAAQTSSSPRIEATWRRREPSGRSLPKSEAHPQATIGSDQVKSGELLHGRVLDAVGRPVPGAVVSIVDRRGDVLATTRARANGSYELRAKAAGVRIDARHPGLAPASAALNSSSAAHPLNLTLPLSSVQTVVNVTALNVPLPAAQVGNTTSTIAAGELQALHSLQAVAALRLLPGLGAIQSGEPGGVVSVFLRGAPADFTKVLLDGIPIQRLDLGGYDFANLMPVGLDQIQVVRGPDSVVYGSDAAAGVIALQTRTGAGLEHPEFDSSTLAGAYATLQHQDQLLGQWGAVDFAFRYGYLFTHNQQPNSKFRNTTYGANLGWHLSRGALLRVNADRSFSDSGQPNALLFYGLPQGAFKHQGETYGSLAFEQRLTPVWTQRLRLTLAEANLFSEIPGPAGVPDGFGDFDGLPITITGANGYQVHGSALLTFGGFPQISPSDTLRRGFSWESEVSLSPLWSLLAGYRYYDERGLSATDAFSRHDNGAYAVVQGGAWNRLFVNAGLSIDRNTPFGTTTNPQASLAWFPRLRGGGFWDQTRLRASAGTALKDPSLDDQQYSLYQELFSASGGPALIAKYGLTPVRPQRARDFDAGIDQYLAAGRAALSATFFDHRYYDVIEDIPVTAFPALGIPAAVAQTALYGGEYNSLTQRARGLELEAHIEWGRAAHWRLFASYTATAAKVLRSYSFDAQAPYINPNFPNIPIGAYAPLVGQRPFRIPPQAAAAVFEYARAGFTSNLTATWMSRRNDSTFLSDANFGNTLLLPNRNLDPAVTLVNWAGTLRLTPTLALLAGIDNLFNHPYQEVIGYPGPHISVRAGLRWTWSPQ